MMKSVKFLVFLIVLMPGVSWAQNIGFEWTANTDDSAIGYAIIMDEGTNVVVDVPSKSITTANYEIGDNLCHTFSIYAYNKQGLRSSVGNMISVCPQPDHVNNFIVEQL